MRKSWFSWINRWSLWAVCWLFLLTNIMPVTEWLPTPRKKSVDTIGMPASPFSQGFSREEMQEAESKEQESKTCEEWMSLARFCQKQPQNTRWEMLRLRDTRETFRNILSFRWKHGVVAFAISLRGPPTCS